LWKYALRKLPTNSETIHENVYEVLYEKMYNGIKPYMCKHTKSMKLYMCKHIYVNMQKYETLYM